MRKGRAQAVACALGIGLAVIGILVAWNRAPRLLRRVPSRTFDYSDRSGFPRPAAEMRGAAAR